MTQILGLETIQGLAGEPPTITEVSRKTMELQDSLRQVWNVAYIAIIPHCFKCHEALTWHCPPDGENNDTVFHCPKCKRIWIKGEGW